MPNWQYNCLGVSAEIAAEVARRFTVPMREVLKPRGIATGAMQLLPTQSAADWYENEPLAKAVRAQHSLSSGDRIGAICSACGKWRWLPIAEGQVPVRRASLDETTALAASHETFGDGWSTFRHLLFQRELAEFLAESAPRIFSVVEINLTP